MNQEQETVLKNQLFEDYGFEIFLNAMEEIQASESVDESIKRILCIEDEKIEDAADSQEENEQEKKKETEEERKAREAKEKEDKKYVAYARDILLGHGELGDKGLFIENPELARRIFDNYYAQVRLQNVPKKNRGEAIEWAIAQLSSHIHNNMPILFEDIYKLKDDIEYFYHRSKDIAKNDRSKHLSDYNYHKLMRALIPFRREQAFKNEKKNRYKIDKEKLQRIMHQTAVLYDGEEGKIVMPHSYEASQFWGSNTKWCISSRETNRHFF